MKIVHVASNYPPSKGGVERIVEQLALRQTRAGHHVDVITTRYGSGPWPVEIDSCGFRVFRLPCINISGYLVAPQMAQLLAQSSADIVHFHGLTAAGSLMGSPIFDGPKICTAYFHPADTYDHTILMNLVVALAAQQSRLYRSITAFTEREANLLEKLTHHKRIYVVPTGIDPVESFQKSPGRGERNRDRVLFIGRLAPNKGLPNLIQAIGKVAASIPTVQLVIVGKDCGKLAETQGLAKRLDVAVTFLGEIPDEALDQLIRTARIVVLPSRYESFGLVALESLARGIPVIVSDGVALADEIANAGCGIKFPYRDVTDLAVSISKLMVSDELWDGMTQKCPGFIAKYSWDSMAARMLDVYDIALEKR